MTVAGTIIIYIGDKILAQIIKEEVWSKRLYFYFFPSTTYKTRLTKIIDETINEYEKTHSHFVTDGMFLFYQSQIFFEHLSLYILFKKGTLENIRLDFTKFPLIILPSSKDLENFYSIFYRKVSTDDIIKFKFIEENYKVQIYEVTKIIEEIKEIVVSIKEDTTITREFIEGLVAAKESKKTIAQKTLEKGKEKIITDFLSDVKLALKSVEKQNNDLDKFILCLEHGQKDIVLEISYDLKVIEEDFPSSRISEIDNASGNKPENNKLINDIFKNIKFLGTLTNKIEESALEFPIKINKEKEIYTKSIYDIFEFRNFYIVEINSGRFDLNESPFILEILAACEYHMKVANDYTFMFGKESLIIPIDKIRSNYVGSDHLALTLNNPVFSAMNAYKRMSEEKIFLMELIREDMKILKNCVNNIELNVKKLNIKKFHF